MPTLAILVSAFAGCLAGGIVPVINAELIVLGAAATLPPEALLPLVFAASAGQMAGKSALFYAGRGAVRLPIGSSRLMDRVSEWTARWQSAGSTLVFASAAAGLPPFYGLSVACGAAGMGFGAFLGAGFAGRCVRFGALAFAPQLLRALLG